MITSVNSEGRYWRMYEILILKKPRTLWKVIVVTKGGWNLYKCKLINTYYGNGTSNFIWQVWKNWITIQQKKTNLTNCCAIKSKNHLNYPAFLVDLLWHVTNIRYYFKDLKLTAFSECHSSDLNLLKKQITEIIKFTHFVYITLAMHNCCTQMHT